MIPPAIGQLSGQAVLDEIAHLAALLHACVANGASVGYILPFDLAAAAAFWRDKVAPGVAARTRALLVARIEGRIVGSVQLNWDTPPNQPHRADVAKLLVAPGHRRAGIARALMAALEREAHLRGRVLLTLDTRSGDAAEPLYLSLGYRVVGIIPWYCLDPDGVRIDSTTIMFKALPARTPAALGSAA
jgi:hypothetical protein